MTLSAYEQLEWKRLQKRKADSLHKNAHNLLPSGARERIAAVGDKARSVPGAAAAYSAVAQGLGKATASTSSRTLSRGASSRSMRAPDMKSLRSKTFIEST